MPVSLAELRKDVAETDVDFGKHGSVHVSYRPSEYSPQLEDQLKELTDEGRPSSSLIEMLCGLLVGWDFLDKPGGDPIPIDADTIYEQRVPTWAMARIVTQIGNEMNDEKKQKPRSVGGSLRRGR